MRTQGVAPYLEEKRERAAVFFCLKPIKEASHSGPIALAFHNSALFGS